MRIRDINPNDTLFCDENSYNYIPSDELPQAFQCGGRANAGKVLMVAPDGYVRLFNVGTGGEPAEYLKSATVSGNVLTLKDKLDNDIVYSVDLTPYYTASQCDNLFFLESEGVAMDGRLHTIENGLPGLVSQVNTNKNNITALNTNKANNFTVDGTSIIMSADRELSANLPSAIRFKGIVPTTADLPASPNEGDMYFVGASQPYNIHIYNGTAWISAGQSTIDLTLYLLKTEAASTYATQTSLAAKEDTSNKINQITTSMTDEQLRQFYVSGKCLQTNLTSIATSLNGKQALITTDNKLDYSLLSNTPTIPDSVVANPTLEGTESELTGIQVGSTKYKVDTVSASNTGTSTTLMPKYLTVNGTEYKTSDITTVINSSSTNDKSAGALAVYQYHDNQKLDASKSTYQTTAPTADITDNGVHIVYLETEPTTKYEGYIYFIK